jgi:hypothetical protein
MLVTSACSWLATRRTTSAGPRLLTSAGSGEVDQLSPKPRKTCRTSYRLQFTVVFVSFCFCFFIYLVLLQIPMQFRKINLTSSILRKSKMTACSELVYRQKSFKVFQPYTLKLNRFWILRLFNCSMILSLTWSQAVYHLKF